MRRIPLCVLALMLAGCIVSPPAPPPVPPTPPVPIPVPPEPIPPTPPTPPQPEPPQPSGDFSAYQGLKAGDLEARIAEVMPAGWTVMDVAGSTPKRTIYHWVTPVVRPGGGFVEWEVQVEGGKVLGSYPW